MIMMIMMVAVHVNITLDLVMRKTVCAECVTLFLCNVNNTNICIPSLFTLQEDYIKYYIKLYQTEAYNVHAP